MVLCTVLWGHQSAEKLAYRQRLTAALASFIEYCGERIKIFRDPISVIYSSFENEILNDCGFVSHLRMSGAAAAAKCVADILLPEDAAILREFSGKIGQGYGDSQKSLCDYCSAALRESEKKQLSDLPGRVKLYRFLPPLAAASVVILFI